MIEPITFKEQAYEALKNSAKTLSYPIIKPIKSMVNHPLHTVVFLLAIAILMICTQYVNTQPIQDFNKKLNYIYNATAEFLRYKTHAILVGCGGGILYILIGRELLNKELTKEVKKAADDYVSSQHENAYELGNTHGYARAVKEESAKAFKVGYEMGYQDKSNEKKPLFSPKQIFV